MASDNTIIVKEIRERNESELRSLLESKVEELHKAKFKHALGQLEKTHNLKLLKKDIARLNTVLAEKVAAATAGESAS